VPPSRIGRCILLPLLFFSTYAQSFNEHQVKAAFLLNFTRFVQWPARNSPTDPFALCIIGDDPFGSVLDQLVEGETVAGHKLVVRRARNAAPADCGVVYISREEKNVAALLASVAPGVLTVGEGDAFLDEGGMISFVLDHSRVRFDVDQTAARRAGVVLSSRLLTVARSVR
jgi:hypothetical protein